MQGRISLIGPIAEPGKPAVGGYESANLRLLSVLRRIDRDALTHPYPRASGSSLAKAMQYGWAFSALLLKLLGRSGRGNAVHFTPLCRHFLAAETLLACAARLRGNRLTVDLRAGMQESWYRRSTPMYRWLFRRLLAVATTITFEGEAYAPWLESLRPETRRVWLPNFVPVSMVGTARSWNPAAGPHLVYVGAITQAKGVEASIRAFRALQRSVPRATLTLIGAASSSYELELERKGLLPAGVALTGALPPDEILRRLDDSHFFLFLSRWFGEGHSNALTEAMARGCVPVASRHGFSESVIGQAELMVADSEDADAIAGRIAQIWRGGDWPGLSTRMMARVAENFTDRQALDTLLGIYGARQPSTEDSP